MKRLTKVDGIGMNECIKCFGCDPEKAGPHLEHCGYCEHWQHILDRLAAYEDTGLTPEEIMSLCEMDRRAKMAEAARELPAVDAVPVVHAHWVRDDLGQPSCSACHMPSNYDGWGTVAEEVATCPSCGVTMDEEPTP